MFNFSILTYIWFSISYCSSTQIVSSDAKHCSFIDVEIAKSQFAVELQVRKADNT